MGDFGKFVKEKIKKRFSDCITRKYNPKSSFNEPWCLKIINNMQKEKKNE